MSEPLSQEGSSRAPGLSCSGPRWSCVAAELVRAWRSGPAALTAASASSHVLAPRAPFTHLPPSSWFVKRGCLGPSLEGAVPFSECISFNVLCFLSQFQHLDISHIVLLLLQVGVFITFFSQTML